MNWAPLSLYLYYYYYYYSLSVYIYTYIYVRMTFNEIRWFCREMTLQGMTIETDMHTYRAKHALTSKM